MPRPENASDVLAHIPTVFSPTATKGHQLLEHLRTLVKNLEAGSLLPAERTIAEHFGVARMTVRQQVETLTAEGHLFRIPGRGTFVTHPRFIQTEAMSSFSRDMRARGMKPGSRVLRIRITNADSTIATRLEIQDGDPVLHISRIRTADSVPMALERTNLPANRFPGLDQEDLSSKSLFEIIENRYHVRPTSAEQQVSAVLIRGRDAKLLEVTAGLPAFLMERLTRDNMGHVIEFGRSLYRGDRYNVLMHVGMQGTP